MTRSMSSSTRPSCASSRSFSRTASRSSKGSETCSAAAVTRHSLYTPRREQTRASRSIRCSGRSPSCATHGALELDALQDERELHAFELHARAARNELLGKTEASSSKTFSQHAVAGPIPEQAAHLVATLVEEHEQVPRDRRQLFLQSGDN